MLAKNHSNSAIVAANAIIWVALSLTVAAQAEDYSRFQSPLGFELETATLADIQEVLGSAEEFEIPESHHQFGVCYFTKDSGEIVVFSTGREFGGPAKLLLGVTFHAENTDKFPCSESTLESTALDVGGLNLRVLPSDFASLASGQPEQLDNGYVDFDLAYHRELTDEETERFTARSIDPHLIEGADVGLGIWARFSEESAIEVGVWQITTF